MLSDRGGILLKRQTQAFWERTREGALLGRVSVGRSWPRAIATEPISQAPGACSGPSELALGGTGAGPLEPRDDVIDEDAPEGG